MVYLISFFDNKKSGNRLYQPINGTSDLVNMSAYTNQFMNFGKSKVIFLMIYLGFLGHGFLLGLFAHRHLGKQVLEFIVVDFRFFQVLPNAVERATT